METTIRSRSWYGWLGAALVLSAYLLVSVGTISAKGAPFQLMNLFGSVGLVIASAAKRDYPPVVLNLIWGLVAAVVLTTLLLR
jgi:hypothetical protein